VIDFYLIQSVQSASGVHRVSCSESKREYSLGNRPELEAADFTPSSLGLRMDEIIFPVPHMPSRRHRDYFSVPYVWLIAHTDKVSILYF
jgi:hypothetical protein